MALDWRREFLQVVQEAFEKEREVLKARLRGSDPGGYSSVLERLERVVQGQVSPASARRPEGPPPATDRERQGRGSARAFGCRVSPTVERGSDRGARPAPVHITVPFYA